jgi:mono/diheme cytochrome c family protein
MQRKMSFGASMAVAAAIIMVVLIAPSQLASAGEGVSKEYAALAAAPESARLRQNPLVSDLHTTAAGRKLFAQHCAQCHGKSGEGTNRAPSLLEDEVQNATPGTLFWLLTNGVVRHGMPVWSKLPEPQRWQIVSYIQRLKTEAHPVSANHASTTVGQSQ